ncbi:MAG: ElyC/SanA/YdcF family protein [Bauldia sp.]
MAKTLIILYGHENDENCVLSDDAKQRCRSAIEMFNRLEEAETADILPTGAYGKFNPTNTPHGDHLICLLQKQDDPKIRTHILSPTNSSNTIEDSFCARKVYFDGNYTRIIAITSDYHAPRVRYILRRMMPDIDAEVVIAPSNPMAFPSKDNAEKRKLLTLKFEWVDVPLYRQNADFPNEIHESARAEQHHYDTVSIAVVPAIILVGAAPALGALEGVESFVAHFLAAAVSFGFLLIYDRCAQFASFARKVMKYIEIGFDRRGFSARTGPVAFQVVGLRLPSPRIRNVVRFISLGLIAFNLVKGIALLSSSAPTPLDASNDSLPPVIDGDVLDDDRLLSATPEALQRVELHGERSGKLVEGPRGTVLLGYVLDVV